MFIKYLFIFITFTLVLFFVLCLDPLELESQTAVIHWEKNTGLPQEQQVTSALSNSTAALSQLVLFP